MNGCAIIHTVDSDVSTYSHWPAGKQPGTYRFERLPSQQAQGVEQNKLEALARPSIEAAGFKLAASGAAPDVTMQLMVRVNRSNVYVHHDPFWWRGSYHFARPAPRFSPYHRPHYHHHGSAGFYFELPRYVREVVLLVRDPALNQTLYEAHAVSEGNTPGTDLIVGALFKAALVDFPHAGVNPRPVVITIAPPVVARPTSALPALEADARKE